MTAQSNIENSKSTEPSESFFVRDFVVSGPVPKERAEEIYKEFINKNRTEDGPKPEFVDVTDHVTHWVGLHILEGHTYEIPIADTPRSFCTPKNLQLFLYNIVDHCVNMVRSMKGPNDNGKSFLDGGSFSNGYLLLTTTIEDTLSSCYACSMTVKLDSVVLKPDRTFNFVFCITLPNMCVVLVEIPYEGSKSWLG